METPLLLIRAYLKSKGANRLPHVKQGSLLDHLVRVSDLIGVWKLDGRAQRAALCHSIYSSSHYHNTLIPQEERDHVKALIGEDAERLVAYFHRLDRTSLSENAATGTFSFADRTTGLRVEISEEDFRSLLHILAANQLDHLDAWNAESIAAECNAFAPFKSHFTDAAWKALIAAGMRSDLSSGEDTLRFIGHAGVWLSTNTVSLVVDPWLYSSNANTPLLFGFHPEQKTIDYLIPRPTFTTLDMAPDVVLLSHFHTHHAPAREIGEFASRKPIHIVCPPIADTHLALIKARMGPKSFSNITFHFCETDATIPLFGLSIQALTHTQKDHLAYFVSNNSSSFMHITDGAPNRERSVTSLDSIWNKFEKKDPHYLFIAASNHSQRTTTKEGGRDILEHTTLSPIQAAKLTSLIRPKQVGLIGMYNFSIWDSALEYTQTPQDTESEFAWAMSFLLPNIKVHLLRPGNEFPFS